MKKVIFVFIIFFTVSSMAFSQNNNEWRWGGLIRFRPMATIFGLALGGFEICADWVPYVTPNIGIPIEIDFCIIGGTTVFGIMSGIEVIPIRHKEKNGLYLTAIAGPFFIENQGFTFGGRTNIGYQIVTGGGFVFTPAVGVKYNGLTGVFLDMMLDIGFAYRKC